MVVLLFWVLLSLIVLLFAVRAIREIFFSSPVKEKIYKIKLAKELDDEVVEFNKGYKKFTF